MELTKEQIQFIENRLINEGVKYWDIRIEMLDHIVTDVENRLDYGDPFNEAVQNAMVKLGWNGSFENKIQNKHVQYQKNYRNLFFKEYRSFFTSLKTLSFFVLLIVLGFTFYESKTLSKVLLFSFIIPFGIFVVYSFIHYKKVFKSINLFTSFNLATFSISLFNMFIFIPQVFFDLEKLPSTYLTIIAILMFPMFYVSLKTFYQNYRKTNKLYSKLIK